MPAAFLPTLSLCLFKLLEFNRNIKSFLVKVKNLSFSFTFAVLTSSKKLLLFNPLWGGDWCSGVGAKRCCYLPPSRSKVHAGMMHPHPCGTVQP